MKQFYAVERLLQYPATLKTIFLVVIVLFFAQLFFAQGSASTIPVTVMDKPGKTVFNTTGSVFETYRFGRTFAGGIYIAEVLNGNNVESVKLVKAN